MGKITNLLQFLKDDTGQYSAMRLVFILWSFVIALVWTYLSIKTGVFVSIPNSLITLIGMLLGGKVLQSASESLTPPKS